MDTLLKVFCAGAVKSAIADFAQSFERETGHGLQFTFGTVGGLLDRIEAGEPADVLVLARPPLEQAAQRGKVLPGSIVDLGRVGVGIAVHNDAPSPDVSTPDALRTALLAARSLAYGDPAKGDSSGIHFAQVLDRLGITQEMGAKTILAPVGLAVAELVERGEAQMGATQASVIRACRGIKLVGLLPASLQHYTTYAAAVTTDAVSGEAAGRFVDYLTTAPAKSGFARAGFDPAS